MPVIGTRVDIRESAVEGTNRSPHIKVVAHHHAEKLSDITVLFASRSVAFGFEIGGLSRRKTLVSYEALL